MKEVLKDIKAGLPWYLYIVGAVALLMCVIGFFLPPVGVIDGSVLTAAGELMGGFWLFYVTSNIPRYIQLGATARIKRGDTEITVSAEPNKDGE